MQAIEKLPFGATGHLSTRAIFGSVSLKAASETEAARTLDLLLEYGINHIDTAPRYGDAEICVGRWMKHQRERFFLATKTDQNTYEGAREQFHRSLDRLQVDRVDLLQLHNCTDVVGREIVMGPGGALEFLVEAKAQNLARHIGITGHGLLAPEMHRQSLERFAFDTVLLPCNYRLLQHPYYARAFNDLIAYCAERNIAVQTIKSVARGLWGSKERTHINWYEPLSDAEAIRKAVQWVLGIPGVFLITVGDLQELPKVLAAAAAFESAPSDRQMKGLVEDFGLEMLFDQVTAS